MQYHDSISKFLFEKLPVRGELVHLDASWQAALERVVYPEAVRSLLGEAMAATALLAATLKFDGALTLQVQGDGPMHLLVVQCTSERQLRGLARWHGTVTAGGLAALAGEGRLAITIEQEGKPERYQGIVPLAGATLAHAIEGYFERSEQLPTRLWLAADARRAAGLLLQALPEERNADAWQHVTVLADTVTPAELLELAPRQLLHRLYHEDDLRLFEPSPVMFRCSCTRERVAGMLRGLGQGEVAAIVQEEGGVKVECQFCGKTYEFDRVDAEGLFAADVPAPGSRATH
ncbi:MAG TPA: Hsp33 family molecular chaperone HslO [Gammaproteobacteria bacterium]|nr:Hsp33 family molecular chaperone HslO [Gammaproteobacteria bacterium]